MAIPGLATSPEAKTGLQVTPYTVYTGLSLRATG